MNTQSSNNPDSLASRRKGRAVIPATRQIYWLVRRELWESRSIYMAPLAVAGLFLVGFAISTVGLAQKMRELAFDPSQLRGAIFGPYDMAAALIMATTLIVAVFYCLDALHSERRDRSILFWKSLPVSDRLTVLSKASIPLVVLPLTTFAVTVATQILMLSLSTAVVLASGLSVETLWKQVPLFETSGMLLYHLFAEHALWYAPIFGWLLLVSAWARRAAFLLATLPLLAIGVVERIAFGTSNFANMLKYWLAGSAESVAYTVPGQMPMDPGTHLTPERLVSSPGLWIGLAIFTVCIVGAVRLRRSQGPI